MKIVKLSLATAITLGLTSGLMANSLNDMFKNGKVDGAVKSMYFNTDDGKTETDKFSVGGRLGFTTAEHNGFSAGVKFYTEHNLGVADKPYVAKDTVLGQAYLQYKTGNTLVKVGRQELNTPLAGADDAAIIPNLFEAVLLVNTDLPNTTLIAAHVTKGYGWDMGNNGQKFESMSAQATGGAIAGEGVNVLAAVYAGLPNTTLQAWYYNATDVLDAFYVDASYSNKFNNLDFTFDTQYYNLNSDSVLETAGVNIDYDVFGVKATLGTNGLTGIFAYNTVDSDGATVHGAWGAYPEYAWASEFFLSSMPQSKELDVTYLALRYDAGFAKFTTAYTTFDTDLKNEDVDVFDLIANWNCMFNENINYNVVYENQDSENGSDKDVIELTVNYTF